MNGSNLRIEPFDPTDAVALVHMWRTSFEFGVGIKDPHPIEEQATFLLERLLPDNKLLVAKQAEVIVGFCASSPQSIAALYVRVENIGQGIGSELLRRAQADSAGSLWLYTFARNQRARRFYERRGFVASAHGFENMWQLEDVRYEWSRAAQARPLSATLPGTWQLTSRIDATASGARVPEPSLGQDPIALLIYDRNGHFAAQFMRRDRSTAVPDGPGGARNNSRALGGYDAYFGTYTVDDAKSTVTQHLLGALSQENVGAVLTRAMQVSGDRLVIELETTAADGTVVVRTLTWQRVGHPAGWT
jgi:ribosomal protein S18 acetylase RimI-like enzyme